MTKCDDLEWWNPKSWVDCAVEKTVVSQVPTAKKYPTVNGEPTGSTWDVATSATQDYLGMAGDTFARDTRTIVVDFVQDAHDVTEPFHKPLGNLLALAVIGGGLFLALRS